MADLLYFPYAEFRSVLTLKTAVLYFERIAVIDPIRTFHGDPLGHPYHESSELLTDLRTLEAEGIVEFIDPACAIQRFGNDVLSGVLQDLRDPAFLDVCRPFAAATWAINARKLPGASDRFLRDLLVNVPLFAHRGSYESQLAEAYGREWVFHEVSYRGIEWLEQKYPWIYRHALHHWAHEDEEAAGLFAGRTPSGEYDDVYEAYLLRSSRFDEVGRSLAPEMREFREIKVPFPVGEAIMVEHALAIAAERQMALLCDEAIHLEVLKARLRRIADSEPVKVLLRDRGYLDKTVTGLAALEIIRETVPSLEAVKLSDLLEFRRRRSAEIERFRIEARRLVTEIESNLWDPEFSRHVGDAINSKVVPALTALTSEVQNCRERFWVKACEAIAKASPLPIIGCVFCGVPPQIAIALGATLSGLTVALEQRAEVRRVRRNGLTFLLDAGRLAARAGLRPRRSADRGRRRRRRKGSA